MEEKKLEALNEENLSEVSGGIIQDMPIINAHNIMLELRYHPACANNEQRLISDILYREGQLYSSRCTTSTYGSLLQAARSECLKMRTAAVRQYSVDVIGRALAKLVG